MRAGSLRHYPFGRTIEPRAAFLVAAVLVLVLLAFAVLIAAGNVPSWVEPGDRVAPFRWEPIARHIG